jgi:hypothetical protein
MPPSIRTACATASLLVVAAIANAEVLTVEYRAVFDAPTPPWPDGVEMVGRYSFDSEALSTDIPDNFVSYPVRSHTFTLSKDAGVRSLITATTSNIFVSNDITIPNSSEVRDQYIVDGQTTGRFRWTAEDSLEIFQVQVSLTTVAAPPNPSLANTDLPLDLTGFPLSGSNVAIVFGDATPTFGTNGRLTSLHFVDEARTVVCEGFFEPFDVDIGLPSKSNRVIPLRISLSDEGGVKLGAEDIAAPIVNVRHAAGVFGGDDLTELIDAAVRATEGNAFVWDAATGLWKYNLGTKPFSQPGTYFVDVTNGDDSYSFSRPCSGKFVRK